MQNFKTYLESKGLTDGTVADYIGRISRVLKAEKLSIDNLPNKIASLVQEYGSKGPKAGIGRRSHCSVISALTHFLKFTTTSTKI